MLCQVTFMYGERSGMWEPLPRGDTFAAKGHKESQRPKAERREPMADSYFLHPSIFIPHDSSFSPLSPCLNVPRSDTLRAHDAATGENQQRISKRRRATDGGIAETIPGGVH